MLAHIRTPEFAKMGDDSTMTVQQLDVTVTEQGPNWWHCSVSGAAEAWARTREKALATALRRLARTIELNAPTDRIEPE